MGMLTSPQAAPPPPPQKAALMQPKPAAPQGPPEPQQADGYDAAMAFVRKTLYAKEAARDVAKALRAEKDIATALSNTAYQMVSIADERSQGAIPDERLVEFAAETLGEVADIAEASGIEVKGAHIAKAMQMMLVRYVTEQGLDPAQLQQAMAQVDPEELGKQLDKEGA